MPRQNDRFFEVLEPLQSGGVMWKPKLTIMVGLSGSGRNDVARTIAKEQNAELISFAQIYQEKFVIPNKSTIPGIMPQENKRENQKLTQPEMEEIVWLEFCKKIRLTLEEKKSVVADAPNIAMKDRRRILQRIKGLDITKQCQIVPCMYNQCLKVIKEKDISEREVERQLYRFEIPFTEEGFDEIRISETWPIEEINWNAFRNFDQKNPHHKFSLYDHCRYAYKSFMEKGYSQELMLGALLHDYGKMFTQTIGDDGIAHYYSHHNVGAYHVLCMFPVELSLDLIFLVNYHMFAFECDKNEKAKKKWKRRFGDEKFNILLNFHESDLAAR